MSETKVIEENGLRITLTYEIVDEDAFNALVDELNYDDPTAHPFDNGPTSLSDVQKEYDYWKNVADKIGIPFNLVEMYALQEAYGRKIEEYKSGECEPDPVFLLYEELLPFFNDCYGDINERVQDSSGYFIYDVIEGKYEEFLEVVRLGHGGRLIEAFKLMEEIIDSFISEWEKRYSTS